MHTVTVDNELVQQSRAFRDRAKSLRFQGKTLGPILESTYRRRASELELEAFVSELQSGLPYGEVTAPAA